MQTLELLITKSSQNCSLVGSELLLYGVPALCMSLPNHSFKLSLLFTHKINIKNFNLITGAMNALKRKKRLETQLAQIDGTLSTIEFQREALENAQSNTEVLKTMSLAAKALKHAQQNL